MPTRAFDGVERFLEEREADHIVVRVSNDSIARDDLHDQDEHHVPDDERVHKVRQDDLHRFPGPRPGRDGHHFRRDVYKNRPVLEISQHDERSN